MEVDACTCVAGHGFTLSLFLLCTCLLALCTCLLALCMSGESSRSSPVRRRESLNVHNMLGIRTEVRNSDKHDRLKADLIENIWQMFGNVDD